MCIIPKERINTERGEILLIEERKKNNVRGKLTRGMERQAVTVINQVFHGQPNRKW